MLASCRLWRQQASGLVRGSSGWVRELSGAAVLRSAPSLPSWQRAAAQKAAKGMAFGRQGARRSSGHLTFSAGSPYPERHVLKPIGLLQKLRHRPLALTFLGGLAVGVAGFVYFAIDEVPITGRIRLNVLPYDLEVDMGQYFYRDILRSNKELIMPYDDSVSVAVRLVGEAIVQASGIPELQDLAWEFTVLDSGEMNAAVLMGGKVLFFSGMLNVLDGVDSLAVVLAHEMAHVLARHTGEQLTSSSTLVALNLLLSSLTSMHLPEMATQLLWTLPNSRMNESEADFIGLMLMARAGFDPREAPALWRRMAEVGGEEPPVYNSTHPPHATRVQQLEEWMPLAMEEYEKALSRRDNPE